MITSHHLRQQALEKSSNHFLMSFQVQPKTTQKGFLNESQGMTCTPFCSFQNSHVCTLLLHNAAVPAGVQQMEAFTHLSFTAHHASTPMGVFVVSAAKKRAELHIIQQYLNDFLKLHKYCDQSHDLEVVVSIFQHTAFS